MAPRSAHVGRRVALAVPPGLYQQIEDWAEAEGRPVASLCMGLIEQGIRAAQVDGLIPGPVETLEEFFRRREQERLEVESEAEKASKAEEAKEAIRLEIERLKAELLAGRDA